MTLDLARLSPSLPAGVELHDRLASTQARAKEAARTGAEHGYAVLAEVQESGRGRLGRVWDVAVGAGVLVTVVVRPAVQAVQAPLLCLGAAVAVIEAIEATRTDPGPPYGIKWPNDVLAHDGRKVAGILAECDPRSDGTVNYALLGIGLNVHGAPPLPTATCLDRVEDGVRDRTALTAALVQAVVRWTDRLVVDPGSVLGQWRRDQVTLGRRVRIGEVTGEAVALAPSGALKVVDDAGAVHVVSTGDVEMVGRA